MYVDTHINTHVSSYLKPSGCVAYSQAIAVAKLTRQGEVGL